MHATLPLLQSTDFPALRRRRLATLQVNLGYRCNQSCAHCHVNAGPTRTEMMSEDTLGLILKVMKERKVETLDITGGAPELHPGFRSLVADARRQGSRVIDRCNLTVLMEPGQADLAQFLAGAGVEVVASLPCYTAENVDRQRGRGVFDQSVRALQKLNALGYGRAGSGLILNLVYNPLGPSLPPPQHALEADYRRELRARFGIEFTALFTLTNMPIQRFGSMLISQGRFEAYLDLLRQNHVARNLDGVMCRDLLSVDYRGYLFDCDFNQQLGLPLRDPRFGHDRPHLRHLIEVDPIDASIEVADHCFGCTAGSGSSCGGALQSGAAR